jgi:hypothetical protein
MGEMMPEPEPQPAVVDRRLLIRGGGVPMPRLDGGDAIYR